MCLSVLLILLVQSLDLDPVLLKLVEDNTRPMVVAEGRWSGRGADLLVGEGAEAQMFLVGESHGNDETPELVETLAEELFLHEYEVFAIETGPLTAEKLTEMVIDGEDAFAEFFDRYPMAIPFFNWRREAQMLCAMADMGFELWGLDQEFAASPQFFFDELDRETSSSDVKEMLQELRSAERKAIQAFRAGNPTEGFLQTVTPATLSSLQQAFHDAPGRATRILGELQDSAAIYQLFQQGRNYESNLRRIQLMKRNFAGRWNEALEDRGEAPRVLMKFGAMHMGRGYSSLNQLDLGNQAAELSYANGRDSFHLFVTGLRQQQRDGSVVDFKSGAPYLEWLAGYVSKDHWTVLDLRELRPYFHVDSRRDGHEQFASLVFRFDAMAIKSDLTQATQFGSD